MDRAFRRREVGGDTIISAIFALNPNNIWIGGFDGQVWNATSSSSEPPVISNVETESNQNSTTLTWSTDKDSSSQVRYGLTNSVSLETQEIDLDPRTKNHSVTIENLVKCTTYYYQVVSKDSDENEGVGEVGNFTTNGCAGSAAVEDEVSDLVDISESEQTIELLNDNNKGTKLTVPQNFYEGNLVFQIKSLNKTQTITGTGTPTQGYSLVGSYIYDIKPLTTSGEYVEEFDDSVEVTMFFDEEELGDINTDTLAIYRWDGEEWSQLSDCEVSLDGSNSSITCTTTEFSTFGLFGEGQSSESPSDESSSSSSSRSFFKKDPSCTDPIPNGAPDLFQIDVTDSQAKLYFSPVGSPNNKYAIVYGHESGVEMYGVIFNYSDTSGVITYTINDLSPNSTYYFKVRGQNNCMPGEWSKEVKVKTGVSS